MTTGTGPLLRLRLLPAEMRAILVLVVRLVAVLVAAGWGSQLLEAAMGMDRWSAALFAPLVVFVLAAPLVYVLVVAPARRLLRDTVAGREERETELRAQAERQEFDGTLRRAFELARDEDAALDVVARAGAIVSPVAPVELLLSDSSEAHLRAVVRSDEGDGQGCGVAEPWSCPAMATGRTRTFANSTDLDACPQLRRHPEGDRSALCVPVNFLGRALGVLHRAGEPDVPITDETVQRMRLLGGQTGGTLGMLRVLARSQAQAATDSLTGLLNRRSLIDSVQGLEHIGRSYAVLLADLDLFKQLNDVHGHECGDRALRLFAKVLRDCVREGDLVSRYGGEEFVIVLPGQTTETSLVVGERIRKSLDAALSTGGSPRFTTSIGIADSGGGLDFDAVVREADGALFEAKHQGRDQVCVASRDATVPAQRTPVESETNS